MASYTVECFSNTGFTVHNVPDSAATLRRLVTPVSFPAVWVLQDRERPTIRLATTYDRIKNVDYCYIGSTYYWVTAINMLNENTAELSLQTDYLTTIGISQLGITSGWCTRRHVTSDNLFDNVIPEDFTPSNEMVIDVGRALGDIDPTQDFINVIAATVYFPKLEFQADTYTDTVNSLTVSVPKLPVVAVDSVMKMTVADGERQFNMPQVGLFNADNGDIKNAVQAVRSLGVESSIIAAYKIPSYFASAVEADGWFSTVTGKFIDGLTSGLPFQYNGTVKNKKVFSGQFQKYRLYSITSGDGVEYSPEDIQHTGDTEPKFVIFADPQPEGKPYCRPKYYRGDTNNLFIECVEGSNWLNYQLVYRGRSGQAFADLNYKRANMTHYVNTVFDVAGKAATANPLEIAKSMGGGVVGAMQLTQDYYNAKNTVVPDIHFPLSSNLQNYYSNGFWVSRVRLSDADTVRFDNYLTQFGYAVYEPLTQACFTGRKYFNYVKGESINLKNSFPLSMRTGAIAQLVNGVRVWHVLPDIRYMYDNPIG